MISKLQKELLMKKSIRILATSLALSLSACQSTDLAPALDSVAETNDKVLELSEKAMCSPSNIGAATRRYNTPKLRQAYLTICNQIRDSPQGQ
jgi:hypothetical protein